MHDSLLADLAVVMVVAAATGTLMRRVGQPSVLGYLLAGLIVGPYIPIPLFADPHRVEELAEVGVVLVMFVVGLEFRVKHLLSVLPQSGLTAAIQIGALGWAGFTVGTLLGWTTSASITLGAALSISSTMVVGAVLRQHPVDTDVRKHVFGILVVQDVVAIVLIAIVTALAAGESMGAQSVAILVAELAAMVAALLLFGLLALPRLVRWVVGLGDKEALTVVIAGASFGFALAADLFGYSAALGSFIAGMVLAESGRREAVEHAVEPLRALFSAIFFVSIGMTVDPRVAWTSLPLAATVCVVVIGMQFVSVVIGSLLSGNSIRNSVYSGVALGQIGELSFILVNIALDGGIVPAHTLPALVTVATITAFTTPMLLARADQIVAHVDHMLPDKTHDVLIAYQAFVRRTKAVDEGPSLRQPATAVLLDWFALIVLFVVRQSLIPVVAETWQLTLNVGVVLLALPFLLGLGRSGRSLALAVRARVSGGSTTSRLARTLEGLALLSVVLAVGAPTLAVLRPFLTRSWGELGLVVVVVGVAAWLAVRVSHLDSEHTSGVARLAVGVSRHTTDEHEELVVAGPDSGPLAGLDFIPVEIPPTARAVGSTLAELDIRCRTGATVVAICREQDTLALPTGHERVLAHDVLAISGSAEAREHAVELLTAIDDTPTPTAGQP